MRSARLLALPACLFVMPLSAAAQTLTGEALDASTGEHIAGVEIAILHEDGELAGLGVSDEDGEFEIRLGEPGRYQLIGSVIGYDTISVDSLVVAPDEEVTLQLLFGPRPLAVDAVSVVARQQVPTGLMKDYYVRAERNEKFGIGFVLSREELVEFSGQSMATALLHSTGMVEQSLSRGPARLILKRKGATNMVQGPFCDPAFFLNGLPIDEAAVRSIPANDLEGIEIYRGVSQVPLYYLRSGDATECGVVLLWPRRTY